MYNLEQFLKHSHAHYFMPMWCSQVVFLIPLQTNEKKNYDDFKRCYPMNELVLHQTLKNQEFNCVESIRSFIKSNINCILGRFLAQNGWASF